MMLTIVWLSVPAGMPENYLRSYRVIEEGQGMVLQADLTGSMGVLGESLFTPAKETAIPPFTVHQERKSGFVKYEFTCKATGAFIGAIVSGHVIGQDGREVAIIRDPDTFMKRIIRNILGGQADNLLLQDPKTGEELARYHAAARRSSALSLDGWKSLFVAGGERQAGSMTVSDKGERIIDPRLLWGAGPLLHYIRAGSGSGL